MGIEAIVLLKVPASTCEIDNARGLGSDGTAVKLGLSFGTEPELMTAMVRSALGGVLTQHEDARGILVVPDTGWPEDGFDSYQAAVDFFGPLGEWLATDTPEPKGVPSLADQAAALGMQFGGGALGDPSALEKQLEAVQELFAKNPDAANAADKMLKDQLGQMGDAEGLGDLMGMAAKMMEDMSPEQRSQMEAMAQSMFGNAGAGEDVIETTAESVGEGDDDESS